MLNSAWMVISSLHKTRETEGKMVGLFVSFVVIVLNLDNNNNNLFNQRLTDRRLVYNGITQV